MSQRFAGSRFVQIPDGRDGQAACWWMYPTDEPSRAVSIGPYPMTLSADAPVADGRFPVVVISHGSGGSHLLYRTIASRLAQHGFVVVMPEHPGNNRNDNSLASSDENLVHRPQQIVRALDAVHADPELGPRLSDHTGMVGHSIGAYTALAVAGGRPSSRTGTLIEVVSDPRVTALVLLAPVAFWYVPEGALRDVDAQILIFGGEADTGAPAWHAHLIMAQVPDPSKVDYRLVPRAGHYSFLSPFPAAMKNPAFLPSVDLDGFDRAAFHDNLGIQVHEFFDRTLL
ncbi:MAG: alpha/beta fold hydrolase [Kofleriaceae bacterium]